MSESSFPFGAPSSPSPSPFGAPPQQTPAGRHLVEDAPDGADKRQRYLLGGLTALVVAGLGAGAYLLLGGGDDSSAGTASALPKPKTQVTVGTGLPTEQATLPQTYDGLKGQDPFRPLVVVPVAAPSAPPTGAVPAPTGVSQVPTFPVPTYPVPGYTLPGPVPTGGSTLPPGTEKPSSIHLDSVSDGNDKAVFEVGGAKSEVGIGDTFATYFKLLRLEAGRCGTVQFGDERFDICQGEDVRL